MEHEIIKKLIKEANEVRKNCYTPYIDYRVGAALLTKGDKIYLGCNIQDAVLTTNVCAERVAFYKAISDGEKDFKAIAIVGGASGEISEFCTPCGICRQVMCEFCDDEFEIILTNGKVEKIYKLKDLLPLSFNKGNL